MTRLLWETRIRSLRFFPTLLYGLTRAVNQSPAFCMGRDEHGQFGRYDTVSPSYTVFHPETERFTDLWTTYHPDFSVFYRRYLDDMARYGTPGLPKPGTPTNLFCVSALPWLHFRAFNLNLEKGYDFFRRSSPLADTSTVMGMLLCLCPFRSTTASVTDTMWHAW